MPDARPPWSGRALEMAVCSEGMNASAMPAGDRARRPPTPPGHLTSGDNRSGIERRHARAARTVPGMDITIKTVLHPVADVEAAKPVYSALLGFEPQHDSSYYVGYDGAAQHIGLVPGGEGAPVAYWEVEDIKAKLDEVTAAGGTVKEAAHDVGGGRLVATVTDPDGNVLGLLQDPA